MESMPITVFADGAAKGNPGPGGWGTVVVLPDGFVAELGGGERETTNNRMEMSAAIEGLREAERKPGPVAVYTDSTYVIRGITEWIHGWRKRGWRTAGGGAVANQDLWEALASLVARRGKDGAVAWHYVRGHTGVPGNERVDAIASGWASGKRVTLYRGPLVGYDVAIFDLPDDTSVPKRTDASSKRGKGASVRGKGASAHSYLSYVDGKPLRHATWSECERRVKGRSGARFKKAVSAADEVTILRAWGADPSDL